MNNYIFPGPDLRKRRKRREQQKTAKEVQIERKKTADETEWWE